MGLLNPHLRSCPFGNCNAQSSIAENASVAKSVTLCLALRKTRCWRMHVWVDVIWYHEEEKEEKRRRSLGVGHIMVGNNNNNNSIVFTTG